MEFDLTSKQVIGAAITVHRALGPGLLESVYEKCLAYELTQKGLIYQRQLAVPVIYREEVIDCGYRLDLLVDNKVIIEIKSVDFLLDIHEAQILTYMKLSGIHTGLLMNFNVKVLKHGLRRFVL